MKIKAWTICLLLLSFCLTGCHPTHMTPVKESTSTHALASCLSDYAPRQIQIMRWTEISGQDTGVSPFKIRIFVSLLDSFGIPIKSPGTFRFELNERMRRSAKILGKQVIRWEDIDLTDAKLNQEYWEDYLRSYEFSFEIDTLLTNKDYVLQATFILPDQSRLTTEWPLTCP